MYDKHNGARVCGKATLQLCFNESAVLLKAEWASQWMHELSTINTMLLYVSYL